MLYQMVVLCLTYPFIKLEVLRKNKTFLGWDPNLEYSNFEAQVITSKWQHLIFAYRGPRKLRKILNLFSSLQIFKCNFHVISSNSVLVKLLSFLAPEYIMLSKVFEMLLNENRTVGYIHVIGINFKLNSPWTGRKSASDQVRIIKWFRIEIVYFLN